MFDRIKQYIPGSDLFYLAGNAIAQKTSNAAEITKSYIPTYEGTQTSLSNAYKNTTEILRSVHRVSLKKLSNASIFIENAHYGQFIILASAAALTAFLAGNLTQLGNNQTAPTPDNNAPSTVNSNISSDVCPLNSAPSIVNTSINSNTCSLNLVLNSNLGYQNISSIAQQIPVFTTGLPIAAPTFLSTNFPAPPFGLGIECLNTTISVEEPKPIISNISENCKTPTLNFTLPLDLGITYLNETSTVEKPILTPSTVQAEETTIESTSTETSISTSTIELPEPTPFAIEQEVGTNQQEVIQRDICDEIPTQISMNDKSNTEFIFNPSTSHEKWKANCKAIINKELDLDAFKVSHKHLFGLNDYILPAAYITQKLSPKSYCDPIQNLFNQFIEFNKQDFPEGENRTIGTIIDNDIGKESPHKRFFKDVTAACKDITVS